MWETNPSPDLWKELNWLPENSLNSEAIAKLINLGVTRETATALTALKRDMSETHEAQLRYEFAELSWDEQWERIAQVDSVLRELRQQTSHEAATQISQLREAINTWTFSDTQWPYVTVIAQSIVRSWKSILKVWWDSVIWAVYALANPGLAATYLAEQIDWPLWKKDLEYEIPENVAENVA